MSIKSKISRKFYYFSIRSSITNIALASLLIVFSFGTVAQTASDDETPFVEGEMIIQLFDESTMESIKEQYSNINLRPVRQLSRRMNIWLFEYDAAGLKLSSQSAILESVKESDDIQVAQFNHFVTQRQTIPNDPSFGTQWNLNNTGQSGGVVDADVDAPEAWDLVKGDSTISGDQIVVAIIDGGCDLSHPDISFFKNSFEIPSNGIDDDGNGYIDDYDGWNSYNHTGNVSNDTHGTHCAGIAGATSNNNTGVASVNWGVQIMPISGSSTQEATVVESYSYVHEMRSTYNETNGVMGAFVVATSSSFGVDYGNPANYPIWCGMYDSLGAIGILSAAATANIGMNIDVNGDVPTACGSDYLLSVTNTTRYDVRNSGAAYGLTTIDLGAPGTSIYSTVPGSYGTLTGTSMATPHVAGAVGFLYGGACGSLMNKLWLDPDSVALFVKQSIMDGTDSLSSLWGSTVSGGRLNLFNSLQLVMQYPCGVTINHTALADTKESISDYEVLAQIASDTLLNPDSVIVFYSTDAGSSYLPLVMSETTPNDYQAFIPAQSPGTDVEYYIYAKDFKGEAVTTDVYYFRVIAYNLILSPLSGEQAAPVFDTVSYTVTVVNDGVFDDEFWLTITGNSWAMLIRDESGLVDIISTSLMNPDDTVVVTVLVEIPASNYLDADSAHLVVTSNGDTSIQDSVSLITSSAGTALTVPFSETFSSMTIDQNVWHYNIGVVSDDIGVGEPSAPYSAHLDGNPGGADTLMSAIFDLEGMSGLVLRYEFEQQGPGDDPDFNDDLFFEYIDASSQWQLIKKELGQGPGTMAYLEAQADLPAGAYHSNFRLRIRNIATPGSRDDWFVDDIYIGGLPICGDVTGDWDGPNVLDLTYLVDYLFRLGPEPPILWTVDLDGVVGVGISDLTYLVDYLFKEGPAPVCQ